MILPEIDPTASLIQAQDERCAECPPECGVCDAKAHCEDHCTEDCGSPEDDYYEQEEDAAIDASDDYEPNDDILAQQELEDFAQDDCYPEPYDGGDF